MVDILHKVGIKSSSQNDVYKALTTVEGLSAWWTNNTHGESKVGGERCAPSRRHQARQLGIKPRRPKERSMTDHKTGTREEWLAARLELLEAEKALTRRSDEYGAGRV